MFRDNKRRPPIIGFFAGLAAKYPDRTAVWLLGDYQRPTVSALSLSLLFAGQRDKAEAYAREKGHWEAVAKVFAGSYPPIQATPISSSQDLDFLWGAAFATGDAVYVTHIMDWIYDMQASGKYDTEDMFAVTLARQNNDREALKAVLGKYEPTEIRPLAIGASALWSLGSNARQHPFVKAAMEKRRAEAPSSSVGKTLGRLLSR
ncbi:hypothetical protein [Magnetospira sp. QH-2]|uniref:hypothetical protein n=1 Tax=Magnetospira sp. (strain QH-2) TaxID=1288970 RepID=UPI0011DCE852|nr:hypothetical protein [Magnetospira sp. QH-2]